MNNFYIICANLVEKDRKFLLVKETKDKNDGLYNLPAGKLEKNEIIIDGLKREAKEECGIDIEPESFIGIYQRPNKNGANIIIFCFKSKIIAGKVHGTREHPEVDYYSYEEIKDFDKKGLIRSPYIMFMIEKYLNGEIFDLNILGNE